MRVVHRPAGRSARRFLPAAFASYMAASARASNVSCSGASVG